MHLNLRSVVFFLKISICLLLSRYLEIVQMLILFFSSQSNLSGFYDPCPEEEKMLRIRYLFRDAMHEVTYGDNEAVRIPKQCKQCMLFCGKACQVLIFMLVFQLLSQSKTKSFWGAENHSRHATEAFCWLCRSLEKQQVALFFFFLRLLLLNVIL